MKRERGNTIIEVLVIIAILVGLLYPVLAGAQRNARIIVGLDPNTGQPATTLMLEPEIQPDLVGYVPSQREGYKLSVQKLKIDKGWIYILRDVSNTGWTGDDYAAVFVPDNQE